MITQSIFRLVLSSLILTSVLVSCKQESKETQSSDGNASDKKLEGRPDDSGIDPLWVKNAIRFERGVLTTPQEQKNLSLEELPVGDCLYGPFFADKSRALRFYTSFAKKFGSASEELQILLPSESLPLVGSRHEFGSFQPQNGGTYAQAIRYLVQRESLVTGVWSTEAQGGNCVLEFTGLKKSASIGRGRDLESGSVFEQHPMEVQGKLSCQLRVAMNEQAGGQKQNTLKFDARFGCEGLVQSVIAGETEAPKVDPKFYYCGEKLLHIPPGVYQNQASEERLLVDAEDLSLWSCDEKKNLQLRVITQAKKNGNLLTGKMISQKYVEGSINPRCVDDRRGTSEVDVRVTVSQGEIVLEEASSLAPSKYIKVSDGATPDLSAFKSSCKK